MKNYWRRWSKMSLKWQSLCVSQGLPLVDIRAARKACRSLALFISDEKDLFGKKFPGGLLFAIDGNRGLVF